MAFSELYNTLRPTEHIAIYSLLCSLSTDLSLRPLGLKLIIFSIIQNKEHYAQNQINKWVTGRKLFTSITYSALNTLHNASSLLYKKHRRPIRSYLNSYSRCDASLPSIRSCIIQTITNS